MLDLQFRKLLQLGRIHSTLSYLCYSRASKEEDSKQGEENAPRMNRMDNRCQRRNNDTKRRQRLSRVRAVDKAQSSRDGDVGTSKRSWSQNVSFGMRPEVRKGLQGVFNDSRGYDNQEDIAGRMELTAWT